MKWRPKTEPNPLPYSPFKSSTVPRPISWLSSVDPEGRENIAPYSQWQNLTFDAGAVAKPEHHSSRMAQLFPPLARTVHGPRALHLQVGVQDLRFVPVGGELHEEVLAVRPDALAGHASEINGGVARHADAGRSDLAVLHPLQALGQLIDGITFGHNVVNIPVSPAFPQQHW